MYINILIIANIFDIEFKHVSVMFKYRKLMNEVMHGKH